MQKFLIIQTAFLGDVILATPVVSELSRLFPDAQIDLLVRKGNESLVQNNPNINHTWVFDKKQGKWKQIFHLIKQIRSEKYTTVINLHRYGSSGLITWRSGAATKIGFDKNPFSFSYSLKIKHEIGNGKHEVERNLETIAHLGAVSNLRPSLFPSKADFDQIDKYKTLSYFTLAPASVWFTKQLPESKWVELALQLKTKGDVYLMGGPGDRELCKRIQMAADIPDKNNLAGELSLMESAALIAHATRCFVNDSGPLHIASAMNTPTTAFFCATIPEFGFGPLADDIEIKEVQENLDCRPCGLHGGKSCPKGHFKCGDINVRISN
jgi:ADP-heptose:LPS heptosyltransferase